MPGDERYCPNRSGDGWLVPSPALARVGGHHPLTLCPSFVFADALAPSLRGWFSGLEVPSVLLNAG